MSPSTSASSTVSGELFLKSAKLVRLPRRRSNSISIIEEFKLIERISGKPMQYKYIDENRRGDHLCYISNLGKMREHYPKWNITKDLSTTFVEIYESWINRANAAR